MRDIQSLFRGRENAHGSYDSLAGRKATDRGKLVSKAHSLSEPVTQEVWAAHLAGKSRLGIIPVRADGRCGWFVIDLDFYKIGKKSLASVGGFEKLAAAIEAKGLNLVITKSKSGGAHMWGFLEEPVKADLVQAAAKEIFTRLAPWTVLGLTEAEVREHTDIFPKDLSASDIGSWVNMPYFGEECWGVGRDGAQKLDLPEFVAFANDHLIHPDDLSLKKAKDEPKGKPKHKGQGDGTPPCIRAILENGVEEGHRNDVVWHYAVFAKRAFPDNWQEKVHDFNAEKCQPPMRKDEIAVIVKSVGGKDYQYKCDAIRALGIFCDVDDCKKQEFGVGKKGGEEALHTGITHLEKIDGEEPIYLVTMGEGAKPFAVNVQDLYLYANFRKKAMGATNRLTPSLKQPEWEDELKEHLELMQITEAAQDTQMRDRVIKQFQNWCSQSTVTDGIDEATEANCPYWDGKVIWFSGDGFLSQIDRQLRIERDQAYVYLRNWGVQIVKHTVKGKEVKLWCYIPNGPLWFEPMKGKQV